MLELMGMIGSGGTAYSVTVSVDNPTPEPGGAVEFTVDYEGLDVGMELYWTLGGTFTPALVVGGVMDGSFKVTHEEGQFTTTVESVLLENSTALHHLWLEVRILSKTGNVIAESPHLDFQYYPHPIGQQTFNTPGTFEWTVPANVLYLSAITVGGGAGAPAVLSGAGGDGGDLRWRNRIRVTPGEVLTIQVGQGGKSSNLLSERHGKDSLIKQGDVEVLRARGGSSPNKSTETTYEYIPARRVGLRTIPGKWIMPSRYPMIGGGEGGQGGPGGEGVGPGGGGGAAGYNRGRSGDGGNRTRFRYNRGSSRNPNWFDGGRDGIAGGGGGGTFYLTTTNNSYHATPGGGVGLLGEGTSGRGAANNDATIGGGGGSEGIDGLWSLAGAYGGGGRGRSSINSPFPGGVDGAGGAVRLIWGVGRAFPRTNTGVR